MMDSPHDTKYTNQQEKTKKNTYKSRAYAKAETNRLRTDITQQTLDGIHEYD